MEMTRLREKLENYQKALVRLKESLEESTSNPLVYDGVIKRFEFTYELAWKLLKAYLEYEGIAVVNSPRAVFREAFAAGVLEEGDIWMDMISDRNLTSHTYDEEEAKKIYARIKERYFARLAGLAERLREAGK